LELEAQLPRLAHLTNQAQHECGETASTSYYSDEQRAVLARVIPLLRRAAEAGANPVDIELARAWFAQPIAQRLRNVSGLLNRLFVFVNGPYADRLNAYQPDIDIATAVAASPSTCTCR
jgi:hypothetical protein